MKKTIFILTFVMSTCHFEKTFSYVKPANDHIGLNEMIDFERLPYFGRKSINYQFRNGGIMNAKGPGCLYRVWGTADSSLRTQYLNTVVNFYFDGETTPRISKTWGEIFAGNNSPFLSPLAGDRTVSSGGFYTYLPMPFKESLRMEEVGGVPHWIHCQYLQYDSTEGVTTFTGTENSSSVRSMWTNTGTDPKPQTGVENITGSVNISPGQTVVLLDRNSTGAIWHIKLTINPYNHNNCYNLFLRITWDDFQQPSVNCPVTFFFGDGNRNITSKVNAVRSLPVGLNYSTGEMYCYFPMPFNKKAKIELVNTSASLSFNISSYNIGISSNVYEGLGVYAGYFTAIYKKENATYPHDHIWLETTGSGKWLGAVVRYFGEDLEGDERIYIDDSQSPFIYGTGSEDYFNGGFYFDQGPFSLACWGNPSWTDWIYGPNNNKPYVSAYRFQLADCVRFHRYIRVGMEFGNDVCEVVNFLYMLPEPDMFLSDEIDVGNIQSETAHNYTGQGVGTPSYQTMGYTGDYSDVMITDDGRSVTNFSQFNVSINPSNDGIRIRTRYAGGNYEADVYIDDKKAGIFYMHGHGGVTSSNWGDFDIEIPEDFTKNKSNVTVKIVPKTSNWKDYHYWIYSYITQISTNPPVASKIILTSSPQTIYADGSSTSTVTATVCDANNIPVTASTATIRFTLTGSAGGTLIGSNPVQAVGGIATIIYKAGTSTGVATITATSTGLTSDSVDITLQPQPKPAITVVYPNGGETWQTQTTVTVIWTWTQTDGPVNIDLSTDGGSSWSNLVSNTQNDGSQTIAVPNTPSNSCRIRVQETDGTPSDTSDANFSIVAVGVPILSVDRTELDFGEVEFGKTSTLNFNITNLGSGTLTGTISCADDWVSIMPESFSGDTVVNVTVDNEILAMKEGIWTSTITVLSNGGNADITINLTATCVLVKPNPYNPEQGLLKFFGSGIIPGKTTIKIWTLTGDLIWESGDKQHLPDNQIIWDGKNVEGKNVISGLYIYTYQSPKEKGAGKITVLIK